MPRKVTAFSDEAIKSWINEIQRLREQVECGCKGHAFALDSTELDVSGTVVRYGFKCVLCDITYWTRGTSDLSSHEKKLIDITLGKE